MVKWESDTCKRCIWVMEQVEEEWVGTPDGNQCPYHDTLTDALEANRFKNNIINTINGALELTSNGEKNVTFTLEGDCTIIFHLNNFSPIDVDIVDSLDILIAPEHLNIVVDVENLTITVSRKVDESGIIDVEPDPEPE